LGLPFFCEKPCSAKKVERWSEITERSNHRFTRALLGSATLSSGVNTVKMAYHDNKSDEDRYDDELDEYDEQGAGAGAGRRRQVGRMPNTRVDEMRCARRAIVLRPTAGEAL